jgi:hypothetical protein
MATKSTGRNKSAGAAADLLGQIAAVAPTTAKPKSGKPTKWELPLTSEAHADAERWVKAKSVLEPVEKRVENAKNDFIEYALDVMVEKLFANKAKASNPIVVLYKQDGKTVDHQFQVTMTDKFKYRFPEVPEDTDPRDHFIEVFKSVGLHPSDAENLVDNELDFNPVTGFKTLTELLEGYYGEGREWIDASEANKAAGRKFAALILWDGTGDAPAALNPEEKALVIQRSPGLQVKAGFYDRVATYCQTKVQLHGIFKVIQPIIYPAYAKFAVNDTEIDKTTRKIEAAADILGTGTTSEGDE